MISISSKRTFAVLSAGLLSAAVATPSQAINFVFDYSFDSNNFFNPSTPNGQAARNALQAAAQTYTGLTDNLTAITPGGSNTFTAMPFNPSGGGNLSISNPTIPAGTIVVYAGGMNYTGGTLAVGGPGGYSAGGSQAFLDNVASRGQSGALASTPTDFGPFGGSISFDTVGTDWFYGINNTGRGGNQSDFLSVAIHELGHLMGIGTADSWNAKVTGSNTFNGTASTAAFGGNPPLQPGGGHWAEGTLSNVNGVSQEAALDPTLIQGTRKLFTQLDYAGLTDIGWQVPVPEPTSLAVVGLGGLALLRRRRNG